ncbi:MAG: hypothetical protein NC124_18800 [Clostridium sp.]|nr:hypothetical protein [Clostridium sp.]
MLKMIILVPVIMVCALGGTVGLIKLIKKFSPNGELPKSSIAEKLEEEARKNKK